MKTDELIIELSRNATPVKRLPAPFVRFVRWAGAALLCLGAGIALFGVRDDIPAAIWRLEFTLQAVCLVLLAGLSALSAFLLSVPDRERRFLSVVPIATFVLWGAVILFSLASQKGTQPGRGVMCVRDILVLGGVPGMCLFFLLRQAAPLEPSRVGILGVLASVALGALGAQFICSNDSPMHLLVWHFLPVGLLASIGVLVGRFVLRWNSKA